MSHRPDLTPVQKHTGLALMLHVHWPNLDGAYPGVKVLALKTGRNRDTVGRALTALKLKGWIARLAGPDFRRGISTEWGLRWPAWHEHHDMTPR